MRWVSALHDGVEGVAGWVGVREMPPKGEAPKLELAEFGRALT